MMRSADEYRFYLQEIMQRIGPSIPVHEGCCAGCSFELGEVLEVLKRAGIEYRPRTRSELKREEVQRRRGDVGERKSTGRSS